MPLVTSTSPSWSRTAFESIRPTSMLPVAVNFPVAGLYSSAVEVSPPSHRTSPFCSSVAVPFCPGGISLPVKVNVPEAAADAGAAAKLTARASAASGTMCNRRGRFMKPPSRGRAGTSPASCRAPGPPVRPAPPARHAEPLVPRQPEPEGPPGAEQGGNPYVFRSLGKKWPWPFPGSLGDDVGYPTGDDDQPQHRRVRRVLGIAWVGGDDGLDLVLARAGRDLDPKPRLAVDLHRDDHCRPGRQRLVGLGERGADGHLV